MDIKGYEGYYKIFEDGTIVGARFNRKISQKVNRGGYITVRLYKNHKPKHCRLHRLVAQAYIENPDNKPQVNHIDGNKANNNVSNLEWCTNSENQIHAHTTGLKRRPVGAYNGRAKITWEDVSDIRMFAKSGLKPTQIAKVYPICNSTISGIILNKYWTV